MKKLLAQIKKLWANRAARIKIFAWLATGAVCCLIAVSSVRFVRTIPYKTRPVIFARNGELLVGNRQQFNPRERRRYAANDGKLAALVLGYTSIDTKDCEVGMDGVEKLFDQGCITASPVYLSLDLPLQKELEKLMEQIYTASSPDYVYAAIIRGNGEIVAMAQRPVIDLNDRRKVDYRGLSNFNASYVFPVADELMRCLGSSSAALPAEKEKLGLVERLNLFPNETRGRVLGLRRKNNISIKEAEQQYAGQMTSSLHYLRAYAAVAEKKPLPTLTLWSDKPFPSIGKPQSVEWLAVVRPKNGITVTALGIIRSEADEAFYILLRSVHGDWNPNWPDIQKDKRKQQRVNADITEKLLREWRIGK